MHDARLGKALARALRRKRAGDRKGFLVALGHATVIVKQRAKRERGERVC